MRVYQVKVKGIDMVLEPVFDSRRKAEEYSSKYKNRKTIVKQSSIEETSHVFRILVDDIDGYELKEELYTSIDIARENITSDNERIVKENILTDSIKEYDLIEV